MKLRQLNKLQRFLSLLDSNNIAYVSWKNNHQLELVMRGGSDADLFVPLEYKKGFIKST